MVNGTLLMRLEANAATIGERKLMTVASESGR